MRIVPFIISAIITTALVYVLNIQLTVGKSKTPCLGYFLSPQQGFWQNAESTNVSFDEDLLFPNMHGKVEIYFNDKLIPHVYADNEHDAYFAQGYLHARFRLWQMEFQTHAAAGRLSEIMGEKAGETDFLRIDKFFRRIGMVYGAENAIKDMQKNPNLVAIADAYTAGVNAYINNLKESDIPFEYKLLNYKPERWSNFKTALFLKYMAYDLSGQGEADLTMTNARNYFSQEDFHLLFPAFQDSLDPIIPKGTKFDEPAIKPIMPANVNEDYFKNKDTFTVEAPVKVDKDNGSNNWAVAGSKTKSGKPILCNDPHLGLNLPSLWYEMQITTPKSNAYGASFPGSPAIIIGFNDSIAWGVTNSGRDVKDYYEIKFKDSTMREYWFNNQWMKSNFRKEIIKVKGQPDVEVNLAMTVFGPVTFDNEFQAVNKDGKYYALRWKAHDESPELATFYKLNNAKGYLDYVEAISTFQCPGQNFVFASHSGDIAIRQQGAFPAKWFKQGDFVMPGTDSTYMWQAVIPVKENPMMTNPERGFVSSANQMAVDSTYPYYLGKTSNFPLYRGIIINRKLSEMKDITPDDMKVLQTDNYNVFAETAMPLILKNLPLAKLTDTEGKYFKILSDWNYRNDIKEKGATVFKLFWDSLEVQVFSDEFMKASVPLIWPDRSTLLEAMLKDTSYKFIDNINTLTVKENLEDILLLAFQRATIDLKKIDKEGNLDWGKYKDTRVMHLTKVPSLSRLHLPIGGGEHIINATKGNHGPSWRMIVQMTDKIEAYAIYPGGQSGNPGSKFYDTFVSDWADGKYNSIYFVNKKEAQQGGQMKWFMTISKS